MITSLPFVHTARRYYRLNDLVRFSDWPLSLSQDGFDGWKDNQTGSFRGSKSRNKVSVGEPAEGSLTKVRSGAPGDFGCWVVYSYTTLNKIKSNQSGRFARYPCWSVVAARHWLTVVTVPVSVRAVGRSVAFCKSWCLGRWPWRRPSVSAARNGNRDIAGYLKSHKTMPGGRA